MKEYLIGTGDPDLFKTCMLLAVAASLVLLGFGALRRNVASKNTPQAWDWKFFFLDNSIRIFGNLFLIYVAIRFAVQLSFFYQVGPTGEQLERSDVKLIYSIGVGFCSDMLFYWVQRWRRKFFNATREKFVAKEQAKQQE